MTIGVFDSGVGGMSVANVIEAAIPDAEVTLKEDKANLPYGTKTPDQLFELVLPILEDLAKTCDVIVVACNTVTTTLIDRLREKISTPLVGMEPMIKPAAEQTKTGVIAVCATPTTLASKRYAWLKNEFASNVTVLEPDCSDWASRIQHSRGNQADVKTITEHVIAKGADVIVLGCTHYHWIEEDIKKYASGRAVVLQPEEPVIRQLKRLLG